MAVVTIGAPDKLWEDLVQLPVEALIENRGLNLDERFFLIMKVKRGIVCYLSAQCVVMNFILLSFLLVTKEYRKWMFYPVMFQALIDICGPGVANAIYEWKVVPHMYAFRDWQVVMPAKHEEMK